MLRVYGRLPTYRRRPPLQLESSFLPIMASVPVMCGEALSYVQVPPPATVRAVKAAVKKSARRAEAGATAASPFWRAGTRRRPLERRRPEALPRAAVLQLVRDARRSEPLRRLPSSLLLRQGLSDE